MTRTEELRQQGHTEPTGDSESQYENIPFIRWGDSYNAVEGVIQGFFESPFGDPGNRDCLTMLVENLYKGDGEGSPVLMAQYKQEPAQPVEVGQRVNIGMTNAALKGKILEDRVGHKYHIGFERWVESKKGGNRFRFFAVIPMGEAKSNVEKVKEVLNAEVIDDDLPF
jgi:hypothetical protein